MPKGGRNLEKVLVVINYCSYVEFLEVAYSNCKYLILFYDVYNQHCYLSLFVVSNLQRYSFF